MQKKIEKIVGNQIPISELCSALPVKDHDIFFQNVTALLKNVIESFSANGNEPLVIRN